MTTTTGTELARWDEKNLAVLEEMVDKDDATGVSIPILKINYVGIEDGSKFPKGMWVLGQQKNSDGNITEQGKVVDSLVILSVRNRFSYYNREDPSTNCSSSLHKHGDVVRGNKYQNVCGPCCPFRAKDQNPRCKAQKVVFGVALAADGEAFDCMAYIQGASYVPFTDYYKTLTKRHGKSGSRDIPPFCHPTILGSVKERYAGTTTYFVGTFKQGSMLDMEQIRNFEVRRNGAKQMIDALNAAHVEHRDPVVVETIEETPRAVVVPPEVTADADVPF